MMVLNTGSNCGRACRISLALVGAFSLITAACGPSRISGIYVSHGPAFAGMLQLTQTSDRHVTGVLSVVQLNSSGRVESNEAPLDGAFDDDQLTLTIHGFLFGRTVSGRVRGNTVEIHALGSNGDLDSSVFKRGSPKDFKDYAGELKAKAEGITLSSTLFRRAQQFRQTIQSAEKWISNAQLHAGRIPSVKDYYRKLEDNMRSAVTRERSTSNSVARGQLSVQVNQGDVAGTQADVQVQQTWDLSIGDAGRELSRQFASYPTDCTNRKQLQERGATGQSVDTWQSACQQAQAEKTKFELSYRRIMEQRRELQTFQAAAEAHRQALVAEANRIQ
jgi:hypothetical protein